jgi:uncharacterized metal-binding protein YceD (DUF177 family)
MTDHPIPHPWSIPLPVESLPPEGQEHHIAADAAERAAIAKLAGLLDIARLEADMSTVPRGDGVRVTGRVSATVGQTCVVSLEPMQSEVNEAIDLLYLRDPPDSATGSEEEPGKVGDERIEPLVGGTIDLGAIATEFLILGIDPYPRRPDAAFSPPAADRQADSPFAVLAALKKAQR